MLTIQEKTKKINGKQYALYKCSCGVIKEIRVSAVTSNRTKSCGCLRRKTAKQNGKKAIKHGQTGTYLYNLWETKIKHCCVWKDFNEFYDWIGSIWQEGLVLAPINGYYTTKCKLVNSKDLKKIRTKETCIKKYGVDTHFKNPDIKNQIAQTNLRKYGYTVAAKSDIVKQRTIINNKKKYGVDYPQQLQENKDRRRKRSVDKVGHDSTAWANNIGIARSTFNMWIRKYGFDTAITLTKKQSSIELVIRDILDNLNIKYVTNKKMGSYIPDFICGALTIEADGLYWHSDAVNKNNRYHKEKLDFYEKSGFTALFFRENEIIHKPNIISSIIFNKMRFSNKIFARKCSIVELGLNERKEFFRQNHLMGPGRGKCYALKYGDNIVCALQFTNRQGLLDISRFCNILYTSVTGGYSKLIKHIIRNEDVNIVQTFVDRRYGQGNYLHKFGFELVNEDLSFSWIKNGIVHHRLKFRGNSGYKYGYYKLWDCGQAKYQIKNARH